MCDNYWLTGVLIGGPAQEFLPVFFSSENYSGKCSLSKLEILGGDMARPRTQNLALPIFNFAPPSMPIAITPKPTRPWEDFRTLQLWNWKIGQR